MINAEQRALLVDALTPPAGYTLATGVATTFSLDLVTLLSLPMHLCWLGCAGEEQRESDPLSVIEGLRRTAGRLSVFCQRGRMMPPRMSSDLFSLLEPMVYEANAPHGGAFHPKVWLLSFECLEKNEPMALRLLVLSRNLTNDDCWDLSLRLEGMVDKRRHAQNKPLADFIRRLPVLVSRPLAPLRARDIEALAEDAHRAIWDLPGQFDEISFHVLGLEKKPRPWLPTPHPDECWRELGVISPFITHGALDALSQSAAKSLFLLSRQEELDALPPNWNSSFEQIAVLSEGMQDSDELEDWPERQRGLHAKLFVGRAGRNTHLFLGSANATSAALTRGSNVEFVAQLVGSSRQVGQPVDWLTEKGIGPLIMPYVPSIVAECHHDPDIEKRLEVMRNTLCAAALSLLCVEKRDGWELALQGLGGVELGPVGLSVWLFSLGQKRSQVVVPGRTSEPVRFAELPLEQVSSFMGFRLELNGQELSFALNLTLLGAPEGRELAVLHGALKNREGFMRFLLLLLGDWEPSGNLGGWVSGSGGRQRWSSVEEIPLFELMAKAYSREPDRLSEVARLMKKLQQDEASDASALVPEEFRAMWSCFEEAMGDQG